MQDVSGGFLEGEEGDGSVTIDSRDVDKMLGESEGDALSVEEPAAEDATEQVQRGPRKPRRSRRERRQARMHTVEPFDPPSKEDGKPVRGNKRDKQSRLSSSGVRVRR